MVLYDYDETLGLWFEVNTTSSPSQSHIFHYLHDNLIVGDFDGDGKEEVLGWGKTRKWMTSFEWNGTKWKWKWSNYGDLSLDSYKARFSLIPGDFDNDGKTELVGYNPNGPNDEMLMLDYQWYDKGTKWGMGFKPTIISNTALYPYRDHLHVGDFNGDGNDELLGWKGWITTFKYNPTLEKFDWKFSEEHGDLDEFQVNHPLQTKDPTYSTYLGLADQIIIADIDYTDDKEEILYFEGQLNECYYTHASGFFYGHKAPQSFELSNNLFDITHVGEVTGILPEPYSCRESFYLSVRPIATSPAHIIRHGSRYFTSSPHQNNLKVTGINDSELIDLKIYPTEVNSNSKIVVKSSKSIAQVSIYTTTGALLKEDSNQLDFISSNDLNVGINVIKVKYVDGLFDFVKIYKTE